MMKLFCKLLFFILITNAAFSASIRGMDGYQQYSIDVAKNARNHNNMGNIYFNEKNYNAAFQEYEIAYNLTKDTNAGAPYLYNMARCMIKFNKYKYAQKLIEASIKKDSINITYYKTLVDCYIAQNIHKKELSRHIANNNNPYSRIIAGLIYLKTNQVIEAKIIFDEFINNNPDMIITQDIKQILREINKSSN